MSNWIRVKDKTPELIYKESYDPEYMDEGIDPNFQYSEDVLVLIKCDKDIFYMVARYYHSNGYDSYYWEESHSNDNVEEIFPGKTRVLYWMPIPEIDA